MPDPRMEIPCPACGMPRSIVVYSRRHEQAARERRCFRCATAPDEDVDEMAVERLISGSPVRANRAERQAAVAYLTKHGHSVRLSADRLHVSRRTVERLRQRNNSTRSR